MRPSGHGKFCWPFILLANKQINGEAQEILHQENEIVVGMDFDGKTAFGHMRSLTLQATVNSTLVGLPLPSNTGIREVDWPRILKKIARIYIHVELKNFFVMSISELRSINHALYQLSYFLAGRPKLPQLHINATITETLEIWDVPIVDHLFSPLRLYGSKASLRFTGVPEYIAQSIIADAADRDQPQDFDLFEQRTTLRAKANRYLSLKKIPQLRFHKTADGCRFKGFLKQFEEDFEHTTRDWMNTDQDRLLKTLLERFEKALEEVEEQMLVIKLQQGQKSLD